MRDLTIVHSSDLHIDGKQSEEFHPLCKVLEAARTAAADMLLLAGDIFEHNRLPLALLDRAARLLDDAGIPVVILPGNHDCLVPDSVYRRGGIGDVPNVHVLGASAGERLLFPEHDLEVWGRPHLDYANMSPLGEPPPRAAGRRIAMAHGHWLSGSFDLHRSWLIRDEEIAAAAADYLALGHWPQALPVGDGRVPAYYSGSPDLAGTVNLVRLKGDGSVEVQRLPLGP
ncbi:MAG: DNA repair exonuclease [Chloroflexi bacterium]|nr:DNA repair exonuclease [Chloroflexota bacterium]